MKGINTLAAFARHQIADKPMPKLTWKHGDQTGPNTQTAAVISFESDQPFKAARLWTATSPTRDFRKSRWEAVEPAGIVNEKGKATVPYPTEGFKAILVEVGYETDGLPFTLCTQLRILESKK
jgi:PhoPQ-activated pathogenicity-related protein